MSFAAEIIGAARSQAGLEDFGSGSFRVGLEVLAAALEREARLSAAGE